MIKTKWTPEEDEKLKHFILNTQLSYEQISPILSRTRSACWNRAYELGIKKVYTYKENTVKEDFWFTPNLLNSYWAGFCAADACLQPYKSGNGGRFVLDISTKDLVHLETFKKDVEFLGRIETRATQTSNMSKVRISVSKRWFRDLEQNFSITPRKTYRLAPPPNLNDLCNFSYLIGYIDGDGCIRHYTNNLGYSYINIGFVSSSQHILAWIKGLLDGFFPINSYCADGKFREVSVQPELNYYRFYIRGYRAFAIFNFLKDFPVPKLARKWNNPNVLQFLEEKKQQYPDFFNLTPELQEIRNKLG